MKQGLKFVALLIGLLILIPSGLSYAQGNWIVAAQPDLSYSIRDVFFLADGQTGWFVGNDGTILKTMDGGATLESVASPVSEHLNKIVLISETTGWIVGENGTILKTADGGATWAVQTPSDATADFNDVAVADEMHAIAVADGGKIEATSDGETWAAQTSGTSNNLYGVSCFGVDKVIAVGKAETIIHTADWGTTWTAATTVAPIQGKDYNAIQMVSSTKAWLVGDGFEALGLKSVFAWTEDGGDTWTLYTPTEELYDNIWDLDFTSDTTGVAVGDDGTVMVTHDGMNWVQQPVGYGTRGSCVAAVETSVWVCRYETILKSEDFGLTWDLLVDVVGHNLYSIAKVSEGHTIAVGYNSALLETTNGGYTWKSRYLVADNKVATQLWGINFINPDTGWVVGTGGFIAKTEDAGDSWHLQADGMTGEWLREVFFVNDTTGWVVAAHGYVIKTEDAGETWTEQTGLPNETLYSIFMLDENNGVIGGADNTLYYTTDGGTTWNLSTFTVDGEQDINGVFFFDATHGWAVGQNGVIQFTADGGATWTAQTSPTTEELEDVYFRNAMEGWIVGDDGAILVTSDGGTTWALQGEGVTGEFIKGIAPKHNSIVWAAAYGGIILKYTDDAYSTTSMIKMNEIFYNAFAMPELECQYIELYNAGSETEYLDGKIVCRLGSDIDGVTSIWQFPGTGTDYPINPGEFKIVTPDAKSYTNLDLSNADFECYIETEFNASDNENVPNLTNLKSTTEFLIAFTSDEVILASGEDVYWEDGIDIETIIDGVEYAKPNTDPMYIDLNDQVDAGYAVGPNGNYQGRPVERKEPGMDTNNSTNDFRMTAAPTPWDMAASFSVSGAINYYSNENAVADADVNMTGFASYTAKSDLSGQFMIDYLVDQNFLLAPDKMGDLGDAVDPFDAALILQYAVGEENLMPYQKIAGDITDNGEVTPYDASFILRKYVGSLPDFPSGKEWTFVPADLMVDDANWSLAPDFIEFTPLTGDMTGQNFKAFALGDVSGNWGVAQLAKSSGTANLRIAAGVSPNDKTTSYDIVMEQPGIVVSGGFKLKIDDSRCRIVSVRAGDLLAGSQFVSDVKNNPAAFAFASAYPLEGNGVVATVDLEIINDRTDDALPFEFGAVTLNEGSVAIQIDGQSIGSNSAIPDRYALNQNYPNPFNPVTNISFDLPKSSKVTIKVFDLLGKEVATLVDRQMNAGSHAIHFEAGHLASGVYFYQIKARDFTSVKKMILLK